MKGQFAGDLVAAHTHAPDCEAARRQRLPGQSHTATNGAELFVFRWVDESALTIDIKKTTDDAAFTTQREKDNHQRDHEHRAHHQEVSSQEPESFAISC